VFWFLLNHLNFSTVYAIFFKVIISCKLYRSLISSLQQFFYFSGGKSFMFCGIFFYLIGYCTKYFDQFARCAKFCVAQLRKFTLYSSSNEKSVRLLLLSSKGNHFFFFPW
jgi:hypothetical protein